LTIYADSSFLVSNYIQDIHSQEAVRRMQQRPSVWITPLNRSEIAHALWQYAFRGVLTISRLQRYWGEFETDCARGVWGQTDLPGTVWETSVDLARRFGPTLGVRTLDSLHVACALELKAQRFWTFDERQARLAEAVGLDTAS
jgi:predicted nucleic acid-binding protein